MLGPRLAAALLFGLLTIGGDARGQTDETGVRPNIVMIIADDQHYGDFGFMGNDLVQTPNIDELAAQSVRFVNGYVPTAVCRPSLATLLTGLYPHQHGIHFNHPPQMDYPGRREAERLIRAVPTLPRLLGEAGYHSLQTGKFWEGHFRNAGFDQGMTLGEPDLGRQNFGLGNGDLGLVIGRETMRPILRFIDDPSSRPFFVWYAPLLPHVPHDAPERFRAPYRDDPRISGSHRRYYANIAWLDATVGELLRVLEKRDLSGDTLVVFLVDNGWVPDEKAPRHPDAHSKLSAYDAGVRTPILLRWPGRLQPRRDDTPISTVDLAPTLLAAAGLDAAAARLPGQNLLPALLAGTPVPARPIYGENYDRWTTDLDRPEEKVIHRWVRSGNLKLIVPAAPGGRPELYDLGADPEERRDLGRDLRRSPEIAKLRRLLDAWWPLPEREPNPLTVPLGMATLAVAPPTPSSDHA